MVRRGLLLLVALLLGCDERTPVLFPDIGSNDGQPAADGPVTLPDADDPVRLDHGGGSYVYHGRVFIRDAVDPRMNMPGWVELGVGFATAFYESAFAPTATHGACRFGEMVPPPPAVTNWLDAGPVKVSGTLQPMSFTFNPSGYYHDDLKDGTYQLLDAGKSVAVAAGGGADLPAFSAAVVAPAPLKVNSPDLYQMSTTVDTSQDFLVSWAPGSADRVEVLLHCGKTYPEHRVECVSSDDGSLVLPSAVLKALAPSCIVSKTVSIDLVRTNETTVSQGDMQVTVRAATLIRGGLAFK